MPLHKNLKKTKKNSTVSRIVIARSKATKQSHTLNFLFFTFYSLLFTLIIISPIKSAASNIDEEILSIMHSVYLTDDQLQPASEIQNSNLTAQALSLQKPQSAIIKSAIESPQYFNATLAHLHAARNWDKLSPETKQKIAKYIGDKDSQPSAISQQPSANNHQPTANRLASAVDFSNYFPSDSCYGYIKGKETTYETIHFRIFYTKEKIYYRTNSTTSHDAAIESDTSSQNGVPDYIEKIGKAAEDIWKHEINTLGFQSPPIYPEIGKYPILICDLYGRNPGLLGRTNTTRYNGLTAESYIELDNDYANVRIRGGDTEAFVNVTLAHEFFHAIEFGLNWKWPSYWILESSAVWMEDEVYPDVNDYIYQYLSGSAGWFAKPETSIDHFSFLSGDTLAYGSAIFFRHLTENIASSSAMKGIWDLVKNDNMGDFEGQNEITEIDPRTPHIQNYLNSIGKNFNDVFKTFAVANYLKEYRDSKLSFFPNIKTYSTSNLTYPITTSDIIAVYPDTNTLNHAASRYFVFTPPSTFQNIQPPYKATINFSGSKSTTWAAQVIAEKQNGLSDKIDIAIDNDSSGLLLLQGFGTTYKKFALIISNLSTSKNQDNIIFNFTVSIEAQNISVPVTTAAYNAAWNLISIPAVADTTNPLSALNISAGQIYYYDSTAKQLISPNSNNGFGFNSLGRGYWLSLNSPQTFTFNAVTSSNIYEYISLLPGWNIFGSPFTSNILWADSNVTIILADSKTEYTLSQAETNGWIESKIYAYKDSNTGYTSLTSNNNARLEAWKGYFVRCYRQLTLKIKK